MLAHKRGRRGYISQALWEGSHILARVPERVQSRGGRSLAETSTRSLWMVAPAVYQPMRSSSGKPGFTSRRLPCPSCNHQWREARMAWPRGGGDLSQIYRVRKRAWRNTGIGEWGGHAGETWREGRGASRHSSYASNTRRTRIRSTSGPFALYSRLVEDPDQRCSLQGRGGGFWFGSAVRSSNCDAEGRGMS